MNTVHANEYLYQVIMLKRVLEIIKKIFSNQNLLNINYVPNLLIMSFLHMDERWENYRWYIRHEVLTDEQYAFVIGVLIFLVVPVFSCAMHFIEHLMLNFTGLSNFCETASKTFSYAVLQPIVKLYYSQVGIGNRATPI